MREVESLRSLIGQATSVPAGLVAKCESCGKEYRTDGSEEAVMDEGLYSFGGKTGRTGNPEWTLWCPRDDGPINFTDTTLRLR